MIKTILGLTVLFLAIIQINSFHNSDVNSEMVKLKIAYNVLVNSEKDDYDIFIMNLDGSGKSNLINHPDVAWTYYGYKNNIYFISDRDTCHRCYYLYSMNLDGDDVKKISDVRLRDSWMGSRNNGEELIINPHPQVDSAFYVINLNGQIIRRIYTGLVYSSDPAFSPDGKMIAFRGANKKFKKENGFIDEIYLMNSDGSDLKQLTHYPFNDTTAPWYSYKAGPPKFHPSGEFISYHSFQDGKYSLFAVSIDGDKEWKLTENKSSEGWHDWSPDGKWLAIELFDTKQTQFNIGLMNWETKELSILTDSTYKYQQAPIFVTE